MVGAVGHPVKEYRRSWHRVSSSLCTPLFIGRHSQHQLLLTICHSLGNYTFTGCFCYLNSTRITHCKYITQHHLLSYLMLVNLNLGVHEL